MIDRRELLKAGVAVALTSSLAAALPVAAVAKTVQAGDFKVTTFSDGQLNLPLSMLAQNAPQVERAAVLQAAGQQGDTYASPLNVTLIETPKDKILIDVGSGPHFMGSAGKLTENLEGANVDPEKITKVIYTHAHPDHVWGTVNDFDELSFPNASYYISEVEWNFWMAKDVLTKLPKERHAFAVGAQRNLKAAKEQLKTIKPGVEVVAGVNVLETGGHTPGHISLEVGAGKGAIVVLGDALTHPIISFQYPDWRPATDQEPERAVATRRKLLDKLVTDGNSIVGYHLPTPGLGRVERKGHAFRFAPMV